MKLWIRLHWNSRTEPNWINVPLEEKEYWENTLHKGCVKTSSTDYHEGEIMKTTIEAAENMATREKMLRNIGYMKAESIRKEERKKGQRFLFQEFQC